MRIPFLFMLLLLSAFWGCEKNNDLQSPQGDLFFKGNWEGIPFSQQFNIGAACVYVDDVKLVFPELILNSGAIRFDTIEFESMNERGLLCKGKYEIQKEPKNEYEIEIQLNIPAACGDITLDGGELVIKRYDGGMLTGNVVLMSKENRINCDFRLPVINLIPQIPLPPRKMDGSIVEFQEINDDYPSNCLKFGQLTLSGEVKGVSLNNEIAEGYIKLSKWTLEIDALTKTDLRSIDIEMNAEDIDKKLRIGNFTLLPISNEDAELSQDEFKAEWEDYHSSNPSGEDSPMEGTFSIHGYTEHAMVGEYDLTIFEKDGSRGMVKGKFKLPLRLK